MDVELASTSEVTNAAAYFVGLHKHFSVDEDGFVLGMSGQRVELGVDEKYPISIYQDPMPDPAKYGTYWVLNPFSTKAQTSNAMKLLYRSQRVQISSLILDFITTVVMAVLTNRGEKVKHDSFVELGSNQNIVNLVAKTTSLKKTIASEIDEKMFHEALSINTEVVVKELVQRLFVPSKLSTKINIPFLNKEDWFSEVADITLRKKTIATFRAIILGVFDVKDSSELTSKYTGEQEDGEPANFASGMRMLFKIHRQFNKFFEDVVDRNVIDLAVLAEHIDKIKSYTKRARLMTADKITKPKEVASESISREIEPSRRRRPTSRREEEEEREERSPRSKRFTPSSRTRRRYEDDYDDDYDDRPRRRRRRRDEDDYPEERSVTSLLRRGSPSRRRCEDDYDDDDYDRPRRRRSIRSEAPIDRYGSTFTERVRRSSFFRR